MRKKSFKTKAYARLVSAHAGMSVADVYKGFELAVKYNVEPLVGVFTHAAQGYAINVKGDRQDWNLRQGIEMAQRALTQEPRLRELTLQDLLEPPASVFMVEYRYRLSNPAGEDANIVAETQYVASSLDKARTFVKQETAGGASAPADRWCFCVYGVDVDDDKMQPYDMLFFDRSGELHEAQDEAMAAGALHISPR